jgi:hypothetical protein
MALCCCCFLPTDPNVQRRHVAAAMLSVSLKSFVGLCTWLCLAHDGIKDSVLDTSHQTYTYHEDDHPPSKRQLPLRLRFLGNVLWRSDVMPARWAAPTVLQPTICTLGVEDVIAGKQTAGITCIEGLKADGAGGPPLFVLSSRWGCPSLPRKRLFGRWHFESLCSSQMPQESLLAALLVILLLCDYISRLLPICQMPNAEHHRGTNQHGKK